MNKFLTRCSDQPTYSQKGLKGFLLEDSDDSKEVYFVDSLKGHDDYVKSPNITHSYYIIQGNGEFEIAGESFDVQSGDYIEVPPDHEFSFSGCMKLLLVMTPPFAEGSVESTRPNPKVVD